MSIISQRISRLYDSKFASPTDSVDMSMFMSNLYVSLKDMFSPYPEFTITYSLMKITIDVGSKRCLDVLLNPDDEVIYFEYDVKTPVGDACIFQTVSQLRVHSEGS